MLKYTLTNYRYLTPALIEELKEKMVLSMDLA